MSRTIEKLGRRLRLGVIGGGPGSFIGTVHRTAGRLDDNFEIVASVLSSNPERSRQAGRKIGVAADRAYGSAEEMFAAEAGRPDGMEVVAVMTPNGSHHVLCREAIERGLDIFCDKPLTTSLADAEDLVRRVRASDIVFCHTFNYTGYPMVRQARAMVRDGDLGEIRQVHVEYVQGHAAALTPSESGGAKGWRDDPAETGPSFILGEIGSHSHHMLSFVTGQRVDAVMAQLRSVVPGRSAQDYAGVLLRLSGGAPGILYVTQAAAGAVHGLHFRVFGSKGGLEWHQETPNQLLFSRLGQPALTFERGGPGLKPEAERATRIAIGHPEGYQEAFATLYSDAAEAMIARRLGEKPDALALDFPTVLDGALTMKFIDACVASSDKGAWADSRLDL